MSPGFVSFSGSSTNVFVLQPYVQEDDVTRDARCPSSIVQRYVRRPTQFRASSTNSSFNSFLLSLLFSPNLPFLVRQVFSWFVQHLATGGCRETLDTHPRSVRGTYAIPHNQGLYLELIFCLYFSSPRITSYSPPSSCPTIASFSVCLAASRRWLPLNLQYRYVRRPTQPWP